LGLFKAGVWLSWTVTFSLRCDGAEDHDAEDITTPCTRQSAAKRRERADLKPGINVSGVGATADCIFLSVCRVLPAGIKFAGYECRLVQPAVQDHWACDNLGDAATVWPRRANGPISSGSGASGRTHRRNGAAYTREAAMAAAARRAANPGQSR
jgi:hypothetical protein